MSTHNIDSYEDLTKIIFQLSSNFVKMHLISSSVKLLEEGIWLETHCPGIFVTPSPAWCPNFSHHGKRVIHCSND